MQSPLNTTALTEAREWLARADEDLQVAELTRSATPALLGSSAYHSQQAAEKALRDCFLSGRVSLRDLPSEAAARPTDA
jgi:hypothetical protein